MYRSKCSAPHLAKTRVPIQNPGDSSHNLHSFWIRALSATAILGTFGLLASIAPAVVRAQEPNPTSQPSAAVGNANPISEQNGIYIYHVKVVERSLDAVNYMHRSGSTHLYFESTPLLPGAKGDAKVTSDRGKTQIDAHFEGLTPANGFGKEYLTYVLWAITPNGRAQNLGEVLPQGTKNDIKVTTSLQSFGLIVTAEPYFAVTEPSNVVVLQNVVRPDKTNGIVEQVRANYHLLPRGMYAETAGSHSVLYPIADGKNSPLELYEAYNAVRIAKGAGAATYAPQILAQAETGLQNAAALNNHGNRKMTITEARGAVERAEDARIVSLRKQAADRAQAQVTAKNRAQASAVQSQIQASNAQLDAQRAKAARARADAARQQAEADRTAAQARAAMASRSAANANAAREKLRAQLNTVLATSETARGLIVNMSDVLFNTGKYTLKPSAQISLAKVAGILQAYPGLKVRVEGYTDSTGSESLNQKLSENRALAVEDFLVKQGVSQSNISSIGFGESNPVAPNDTASGRAANRRVNLVVTGNAIGIAQSPTSSPQPSSPMQ